MSNPKRNNLKRVIVTGGSGFIGTNLMELLESRGFSLLNIDINAPRNLAQMRYWHQLNICDKDQLKKTVTEFDPHIIFHLAARTDLDGNSIDDYAANTVGVKNLIEATRKLSSLEFVAFASSRLVCRMEYVPVSQEDYSPDTFYGESKVIGERIVRECGHEMPCNWVIVRPTSIWGPWFGVPYKDFFYAIKAGKYFHPFGRDIFKSFGFVGNTVYQLAGLTNNISLVKGMTIYLCDNIPVDLKYMSNLIQLNFGVGRIRSIPTFVMRLFAVVGDSLKFFGFNNPPLTSFRLNNLLRNMIFDNTPLKTIYPDLPYTLEQGVEITCDWIKQSEIK